MLVSTTVIEVGRRRRQRDHDGGPRRRPVRGLPAAPAARPGRPRWAPGPVPAGHPRRAGQRRPGRGSTPSRPPRDGFELSRVDLELRREGDVLGASQSGFRSSLRSLRVLRDEETIVAAREDGRGAARRRPRRWPPHPPLAGAVVDLEHSVASGFLEKS